MLLQLPIYDTIPGQDYSRRVIFFVENISDVSTLDRKRKKEKKKRRREEKRKGEKIFRRKSRALLTAPEASRLSLRMKTDWFKGANSELALLINTRGALVGVFIFPA